MQDNEANQITAERLTDSIHRDISELVRLYRVPAFSPHVANEIDAIVASHTKLSLLISVLRESRPKLRAVR